MIFNQELANCITHEILIGLGFMHKNDGTGDPRGCWYETGNENFVISIDAWFEVSLIRSDKDPIIVQIETLSELQNLLDFIA